MRRRRKNPSFWAFSGKDLARGATLLIGATIVRELAMRAFVNPYLNKVLPVETQYAPSPPVSEIVAAVERAIETPSVIPNDEEDCKAIGWNWGPCVPAVEGCAACWQPEAPKGLSGLGAQFECYPQARLAVGQTSDPQGYQSCLDAGGRGLPKGGDIFDNLCLPHDWDACWAQAQTDCQAGGGTWQLMYGSPPSVGQCSNGGASPADIPLTKRRIRRQLTARQIQYARQLRAQAPALYSRWLYNAQYPLCAYCPPGTFPPGNCTHHWWQMSNGGWIDMPGGNRCQAAVANEVCDQELQYGAT